MPLTAHFLSSSSIEIIIRVLHEAGYAVSPRYLARFLKMAAMSLPAQPLAALGRMIYRRAIASTQLAGPPVFILGHWRTGTTHIHNILSQDPQFAVLTTFVAFNTNNVLLGRRFFHDLTRRLTPTKRPMDDMSFDIDLPQEEEYAMANISSLSYYKQYSFPKLATYYARRHIFFDDVPPREIEEWKQRYDFLLRKITYLMGHKTLLLKNPPNTARLRHLLALYPDAKVIYLYREPYAVYLSTLRMRLATSDLMQFHDCSEQEQSEHILDTYPRLIERFVTDLPHVRPGHFVAMDYEELKTRPMAALERIYESLRLSGFGEVRARFAAYLDTITDFRPATYRRDESTRRLIDERWGATHALHTQFARP